MSTAEEVLSLLEDLPEQLAELSRIKENVKNGLVATIRLIESQLAEALEDQVLPCPDISPEQLKTEFRALRVYGKHYEKLPVFGNELVILENGKVARACTHDYDPIILEEVENNMFSLSDAEHVIRRYASALHAVSKQWDATLDRLEKLEDMNDRIQTALGYRAA